MAGSSLVEVETLAGLDADSLHLRDDWLVGAVRRVQLEEFGRVGEVFVGRHGVDLSLRRRLHIHARVNRHRHRLGCLAPTRERRDLVARLNLVDRGVIRRTVRLGAADDPDIRGRGRESREPLRDRPAPAGRGDEEIARLGAGRPPAGRREDVRPHVEHRQEVKPPVRVRCGDDLSVLGEVQPRDGIERVEVRTHDDLVIGGRIRRDVHEHVHRAFAELFAWLDIHGLLPRDVHRDERVEVEVGINADGVCGLLGDWLVGSGVCGQHGHPGDEERGDKATHGDSFCLSKFPGDARDFSFGPASAPREPDLSSSNGPGQARAGYR